MPKIDAEADRTRFIVAAAAEATIVSIDSCFCSKEGEQELCNREGFIDGLADDIAGKCSQWQIENAIAVLQKAHDKAIANRGLSASSGPFDFAPPEYIDVGSEPKDFPKSDVTHGYRVYAGHLYSFHSGSDTTKSTRTRQDFWQKH